MACIPGPVWSTWERETSRAWEAGRKGTEGGTRSLRQEAKKRESGDRKMSSIRYSSIIALLPLLLLLYVCSTDYCRAESFRLPRFRCIIQFAGGIFIRIVLRNESGRGGEGFIPGRKVVCRADHGVKSRKIGGPAGCPSEYAPYSESRQIGSTSKTILAENCSTNPYIKCPGYRAGSGEQGQPRP